MVTYTTLERPFAEPKVISPIQEALTSVSILIGIPKDPKLWRKEKFFHRSLMY